MLSCKEVSRLVSDSMERELPLRKRISLRVHLMMCKLCKGYKRQILFLRDAMRHYTASLDSDTPQPKEALSPEARKRIQNALKEK